MKIWNLRVQKNLNIEKIAFKIVQMKSLAMHITNQKWSFDIFTVENLQNILMEHDLTNDFCHKRKIYNFDPYNVFLAIATNIPQRLKCFVLQGHKCNILLCCKAEFSASLLQSSVTWSFTFCGNVNHLGMECSEEQHLYKNLLNIKAFTVTYDQFNASLLSESINLFNTILMTPNFGVVVYQMFFTSIGWG